MTVKRVAALVIVCALGWFLAGFVYGCWCDYWLLKDAQEGMALVTHPLWSGHNAVAYEYKVDETRYEGKSGRNYRDARYMHVEAGEHSPVYYSASHPWISSLRRPETVGAGLPVALLVFAVEILAVITVISPRHRWALNVSGAKRHS